MTGRIAPLPDMPASPGRAAMWSTLSILVFGASLYVALPVAAILPEDLGQAVLPVAWGAVAMGGVLVFARSSFGAWPRVGQETVVMALVGLQLAGAVNAVLHAWTVERFGFFSARLIGPTAGLFAVVVASAVAGFAALVAPAGARFVPGIVTAAMAAGSLGIALLNVPGAMDGIAAESMPLAGLVVACVGYSVAVLGVVLVRFRRR